MDHAKRLELIRLVEANSRLSPGNIATMLGETEAAVTEALQQLADEHVILRYGAVVDWEKAGVETVTAVIDVKMHPQRDVGFDRLAQRISRFSEVKSCYLMSGTYDLSVEIEAPSLKEVARFVSERLSTLDGVASTMTHFVLKRYKHDGVHFGDESEDERLAVTP